MPTDQILQLLIAERERLNRAIEALQGPARRRGRPPAGITIAAPAAPARRKRTAAQNKAQSERMKAYWAKRRREAKKG